MNPLTLSHVLAAVLALSVSGAGIAGPREDQLVAYAAAAKAANPAFAGFPPPAARPCIPSRSALASRIRRPALPATATIRAARPHASRQDGGGDGPVRDPGALRRPGQGREVVQAQLQRSAGP